MRNNFLLIVLIMALIPLTSYSQDNKKKQFTVAVPLLTINRKASRPHQRSK